MKQRKQGGDRALDLAIRLREVAREVAPKEEYDAGDGNDAGLELGLARPAMATATAGRRVEEAPAQLTPGIGRGG